MNARSFKTIFSKRLGCLVAVGEHACSQGKAHGASDAVGTVLAGQGWPEDFVHFVGALTASCALVSLAWAGPAATALPTGGQVAQGAASISQAGAVMNITQSSAKAVVNWNTFDIGTGAKVNISQPGADAVILNRVTSANPSQIFGQLNANGQVVLVNPNGVLFGKDGSVSATSFTASTLGISDANFMAGNSQFERSGSTAAVVNQGSIKTTGGYVALLGASVSNEGKIETKGGTAYLAAAETVKIPVSGSGRIKLELSPSRINAAVANAKGGTIVTEGGQVYMQAAALNNAVASILQSGSIDTTGSQGGAVHLLADGGQIQVYGSIVANSRGKDDQGQPRKGGDIVIGRDEETGALARATDVSGAHLQSDKGFVETSGDYLKTNGVTVKAADWLLDPTDIKIVATGTATPDTASSTASGTTTFQDSGLVNASEVLKSTIESAINNGTNVKIETRNPTGTGAGNISLETALNFNNTGSTDATLSLLAVNGITQTAGSSITATGTKNVNVLFESLGKYGGQDVDNASSAGVALNSTITTNGTVNISGINRSTTGGSGASGVFFYNGAGITASTITVSGTKATASATTESNGIIFSGTNSFTASTGASTFTGSTTSTGNQSGGIYVYDGATLSLNSGSGTMSLQGTNTNTGYRGIRLGYVSGNAQINTSGDVTLNSTSAELLVRAKMTAQSGSLSLKGPQVTLYSDGGIKGANATTVNLEAATLDFGSGGGLVSPSHRRLLGITSH